MGRFWYTLNGRNFRWNFTFAISTMENLLNLKTAYYYILRNLPMIAYIIEIQKPKFANIILWIWLIWAKMLNEIPCTFLSCRELLAYKIIDKKSQLYRLPGHILTQPSPKNWPWIRAHIFYQTSPCWVGSGSSAPPSKHDCGNRSVKEPKTYMGRLECMTSDSPRS